MSVEHKYDIADERLAEYVYQYCSELYPEDYYEDKAKYNYSMLEWIAYGENGSVRNCFEAWLDEYFEANPEHNPFA